MHKLHAYQNSEDGSITIESVFLVPLLFLIGFGAIDASFLMLQNHKVETGLASAGRYLSQTTSPQNYENHARRLATTGQMTIGGQQKIGNWAPANVMIIYKNTANPQTGGVTNYRGGSTIKVVQLSTSVPYQGLGLISGVCEYFCQL